MKRINLGLLATLAVGFISLVACSSSDDAAEPATPTEPEIPILSQITYELTDAARVMPADLSNQMSDIDVTEHTFTLPANIAADQVPVAGQCLIVNTPSEDLPDGLLANVSSVKLTDKGYITIVRSRATR